MLRKNHKSLRLAEAQRGEVGVQETGQGAETAKTAPHW